MIYRCENPTCSRYPNYGGRGISVYQDWHDVDVFIFWALEHGYQDTLQIDRINNDGDYSPTNCRFITAKENNRNKSTNHFLTIDHIKKTISEWGELLGINSNSISRWAITGGDSYAVQKIMERQQFAFCK